MMSCQDRQLCEQELCNADNSLYTGLVGFTAQYPAVHWSAGVSAGELIVIMIYIVILETCLCRVLPLPHLQKSTQSYLAVRRKIAYTCSWLSDVRDAIYSYKRQCQKQDSSVAHATATP